MDLYQIYGQGHYCSQAYFVDSYSGHAFLIQTFSRPFV